MNISTAVYGGLDVSSTIKKYIKNNILSLQVSNSIFGDPKPGIFKYLEITIDGNNYKVPENEYFIYPKNNLNKLGIFYTNNNIPNIVEYCVRDLLKFNDKADILVCSWEKIKDNPFPEIMAMTKSSNHLNIILQILQLLYTAKQFKNYEYVAFLEHDVLYPIDYFDIDNIDGSCIVNMNYIGLSQKGFQQKNQEDQPLHQMVMKFDFAIEYFNKKIKDAILYGSVILEPEHRNIRYTKDPSIHINHKQHFTSHYIIYSNTNTYTNDNYWGFYQNLTEKLF